MKIKDYLLTDIKNEMRATKSLLKRIPDEHMMWKPHDKSWTLGELCTHLVNLISWSDAILNLDEFDLKTVDSPVNAFSNRGDVLNVFDDNSTDFISIINRKSDEELLNQWVLKYNGKEISKQSKISALRTNCISHLIHHRGQLTIYFRLLNIPLPPLYGPTADETSNW